MISAVILHQINRLMQFCKGNENVFGGIQRIFSGDFLQLPPVHNVLSDDPGQSALLAEEFGCYVPHKVHLTKVNIMKCKHETWLRDTLT